MPTTRLLLLALILAPLSVSSAEEAGKEPSGKAFLENGKVKIGADLSSGGSIFWFSELPDGPNLLNHADRGRFIQQSYYGRTDGSVWANKPWRWNPVQGGDYKGKPARLLLNESTKTELHVKSVPVNWAGGQDVEDCTMEEWITLAGQMARIRFRFAYTGQAENPPCHQELPAVFMDYALTDLVYYNGPQPWTGQALKQDRPGWPNESRDCSEEWAAYTGPDGRGLGVYFPGNTHITCYRHPGPAGPEGGGCSYFAPVRTMTIKPGFTHEYTIYLTVGKPEEIRARFGAVRATALKQGPSNK